MATLLAVGLHHGDVGCLHRLPSIPKCLHASVRRLTVSTIIIGLAGHAGTDNVLA